MPDSRSILEGVCNYVYSYDGLLCNDMNILYSASAFDTSGLS